MRHGNFYPFAVLTVTMLAMASCGSTGKTTRSSGDYRLAWERIPMDSTYDRIIDSSATNLIDSYDSLLSPLKRIVFYTRSELRCHPPESTLSDFLVDLLRESAAEKVGHGVDMSLLNFGGIRTDMPKGAVRVYDIYSILPFNNMVIVAKIKGSDLRRMISDIVSIGIQPMGGVRISVEGKKVGSVIIGGKPIDDGKDYYVATVDFLMDGGDGIFVKDYAESVENTGVYMRDLLIGYFDAGKMKEVDPVKDGRVVLAGMDEKKEDQR
ncbi:MAG: 5'-nucleotidase C-terminal domain-containing protein [Bacteroidales bacterium]|jgi:2',3'-cyclic-nucleotide 2'-phosphodiesterase (5'-nucleotidase family)|nr:5'-nucleotidase C-terminal domain-containing protein [Bacteroidales bacterium]MCI2145438.1 5'-nucleotidase C-terminal domain-containing protein [Bacteroidales bacterium]